MSDSLLKLLTDLEQADTGLIEFDPEQHRETLLKAELKIDSYKYVLNRYASRISEIKDEIEELTAIKRTLENKQNNLLELLFWVMKQKNITKFPGQKYVVSLLKKKNIQIIADNPDSKTFLKFPGLIKRTYAWDKMALKKAYASDPISYAGYAKEEEIEYIKFNLKKGLDE